MKKRFTAILLLFVFTLYLRAATTYTEFYCQTTADNLNSGSSANDSAALTYTSAILAGGWDAATGIFTVASGNPSSDGMTNGDFASIYVTAGATVATFIARVTEVSSTTFRVSLTAKSGTAPNTDALGLTSAKIRGAWKGPNAAVGFPFNFAQSTMTDASANVLCVNIKSNNLYSITAAMTHANAGPILFCGYTNTVRDGGHATIDGGTSGASYVLLAVSAANTDLAHFIFQNNGLTGTPQTGVSITAGEAFIRNCVVNNVRGNGISLGNGCTAVACEVYAANLSNSAATGGFASSGNPSIFIRCVSHYNTTANSVGFYNAVASSYFNCIAAGNGSHGFQANHNNGIILQSCDAWNNGGSGASIGGNAAAPAVIVNCNFLKNGAFGLNGATTGGGSRNGVALNCGYGAGTQTNTSGGSTLLSGLYEAGTVTYASGVTPWVDPTNGNFTINLGAAKGVGAGVFTETKSGYSGTVGYPDIGAAQHQETGGSGGGSYTWAQ